MPSMRSIKQFASNPMEVVQTVEATREPVFVARGGQATIAVVEASQYVARMQALEQFERMYGPEGALVRPKASAGVRQANETASAGMRRAWRCMLCGHVECLDELSDDYACPLCGAGKEMFEELALSEE